MSGHEWRYLSTGRVKHALSSTGWLGAGSQVEYETAAGLPECRRCARILGQAVAP